MDDWFLIWDGDMNLDFSNDENLLQIIPSKQQEKAKDYSDRLINLFVNMQEEYNFLKNNFKIKWAKIQHKTHQA